jgi:prepilin-type N-terminal cleavage/methylation domain-containing protein
VRPRDGRRGGFSLVEVTVATAILVVIAGLVMASVNSAGRVGRITAYRTALRTQARIALDRIARLVRDSGPLHITALSGNLSAPLGASGIQFQRATGWNGTAVTWSGLYSVQWIPMPGEIDGDGRDEDGDGLIDDGRIRVTERDTSGVAHTYFLATSCPKYAQGEGQDVALTANGLDDNANGLIDECGLSFDLSGSILTVRISLARRGPDPYDAHHPGGEIVEESVFTSVLLQNP